MAPATAPPDRLPRVPAVRPDARGRHPPRPAAPPGGPARGGAARLFRWYLGFAAGVAAVTWPLVLAPATLWPPHHDARVFTWVMASMGRRLLAAPSLLFHGDAFYPFGESLGYTELLLPPALLGLPGFRWGSPVLTYNLLLLALWPLNGVAMAWVAHRLTGSRPAAWLAGAVFCLSPYFTDYYLEFQMLLAALVPVTLYAWVRALETQAARWLVLALGGLVAQALTSWYYAVILGFGLATLALGVGLLRWRGWRWRRGLLALAAGGALVALVLWPFAAPYLTIRAELGYERGIPESAHHSADLFTFLEPADRTILYRWLPVLPGGGAETSAFVGLVALALAATSLGAVRGAAPPGLRRLRRAVHGGLLVTLALAALACAAPRLRVPLGPLVFRPRAAELVWVLGAMGVAVLGLRGWTVARGGGPRRLERGDWVRLLLLLVGVSAVLALGPTLHVDRQAIGIGPYGRLYPVLFPLHVMRVTTRFAVLTVAGLALLAAVGLAGLEERLRPRPGRRRAVLALLFVGLGLEYAVSPAAYEPVSGAPRPVDAVLRADRDDVAVLEWPTFVAQTDADAMVRSLWHGKRVVNGLSGYVPQTLRELSATLSGPGPAIGSARSQALLRRIYPLRYLVVRLDDPALGDAARAAWEGLRAAPPPLLRSRGRFATTDLYEVVPLPERGSRIERWVSYDFLRRHPVLRLAVRPLTPGLRQGVAIALNGRLLRWAALGDQPVTLALRLDGPLRHAAPNVLTLTHAYRRADAAADPRYDVGRTGVRSPVDLRVRSAGRPWGDAASLEVGGVDWASGRRGYNLVAVDATGAVRDAALFDTFEGVEASRRLAAWVRALPAGTLVAGAVQDEASRELGAAAVDALGTLGVLGDLRGRYRESHAFVGVKGAPPGTALEAIGPRPIELTVGRPPAGPGLEVSELALVDAPR